NREEAGGHLLLTQGVTKPEKRRKLADTPQGASASLTTQGQRKVSPDSAPNQAPRHGVPQPSRPTRSAQNPSRPQTCGLGSSDCPDDVPSNSDPGGAAGHTEDSSNSPSQKVRVLLDELSENSQVRVPGRHQRHRSN
uniref:Uncharacterized protein n=1 Tax=Mustela putorius furo TaxID=9669 RepID=M3YC85_MUSPF